ncbi:MAG: hypothetical protein IPI35_16905 [Deltaproteobacteria bacterium]|nr:hypothetical protein [Deltaproteobacteria bacterium]
MVPPAPDPDDAHLDHDWLKHVDVALRLRRTGLVMQFSSVHDAAAGPLIAHIDAGPPGPLQVLTEAGALGQAPEGATVVLLNAGEWADWLNQFRSVVNQQRLLLLLWLTDEDQMILKRRAPDFYDWISLRVTIPPCAPGYVLDELAATARDGGVLALHNAPSPPPGWTPVHLSAGYAALRTALSEGDVWLIGVTAADECITALIAHAEAHAKGHRGGALALVNPGAVHESTTVLDARPVPWIEATERLRARGVVDPGVAAARADLDPRKILDTVPSPATLIQNPEWDTLLSLVRAGVGPEALGLAARLELVGVVAVWRGEGVGQPFAPPSVVSGAPSTPTLARSVSTRTMVAVARTWLSAQAEAPVFAEALRALDNALSSAHYADDARLTALGPTVMRLRSARRQRPRRGRLWQSCSLSPGLGSQRMMFRRPKRRGGFETSTRRGLFRRPFGRGRSFAA